jgi:type II secretory pathway pseudopilin PulG
MALIHCRDCGAQVSESAVVCPQCGFPLRRDVLAQTAGRGGGGGTGSNAAGIVLGIVVAGFVGIVIIGILAALAIPRFTQASTRAKEKEGEGILKQVYTLENAYYANYGEYSPTLEGLQVVGWDPAVGTSMVNFSSVEVVGAQPGGLCAHVLPRGGKGVEPIRIIDSGEIQRGLLCGEISMSADASDETAALGVLEDVTRAVAAWRRDHGGRFPSTDTELVEAYPSAADDPDFAMGLAPGSGDGNGFCMNIAKRPVPPSRPLLSLDGDGNAWSQPGCAGEVVQSFPLR